MIILKYLLIGVALYAAMDTLLFIVCWIKGGMGELNYATGKLVDIIKTHGLWPMLVDTVIWPIGIPVKVVFLVIYCVKS